MQLLNLFVGATALAAIVSGQSTRYCDPLTSICYQSYTSSGGVTFRIALPNVSAAPYDAILQIVAPVAIKWVGMAWGGHMTYNPLVVAWPNGNSMVVSSRMAYGYNLPSEYTNAEYTPLKGTGVNSTSWTLTVRCRGFSSWLDASLNTATLNPASQSQLAWAQSNTAVNTPASNTSAFNVHDTTGGWTMDLASARSTSFDTWVANNLLVSGTSSSSIPATTTSSSTVTTITTSTIVTSAASSGTSVAVPTSCPGVAAVKYPGQVASGWRAVKIAGGLTTPRGIIMDTAGHLLVVENGKGITVRVLGSDGCVASSKTLIAQTNLNHGIYLTPDGKTLYASGVTTVYKWTYDPVAMTVGTSTVVVNGMYNGGHSTRTLVIPKNKPNLLVVSHGSLENLDLPSGNMATERAVVKVFDMNSVPSGGYNYVTGGWQAGYGLRNEVGLTFDGNNMLWGVENSADDITRTVNGVATDIHIDNPAEELNYFGDVSVANTKWYGYPSCYTVWSPAAIKDKTFSIGDQFVLSPNSTFDDSTCAARSTPARLSFQAHSAPLDNKFDNTYSNMYVSFHGSWDRQPPTGFKLVQIPFSRGSDGSYAPTAAANSGSGYKDIWWNTNVNSCSTTSCFRPVGIWIDAAGRLFVTSDAPGEGELFLLGPASGTTPGSSTTSQPPTTFITTSSSTVVPPVSTTTPAGPTQTHYGQCGGLQWTGPKTCASPYTCKYSNDYYSQCL